MAKKKKQIIPVKFMADFLKERGLKVSDVTKPKRKTNEKN